MMIPWRVLLLILISIFGQESDAAFTGYSRKFGEGHQLETDSIQISPSPTPASSPVEPPASSPVEPPVSAPVEPPSSAPVEPPATPTEPPSSAPVEPPASPSEPPSSVPVEPPASPIQPPSPAVVEPTAPVPAEPPKLVTLAEETCNKVQFTCSDDINNMTACLLSEVNWAKGSILLVNNDGERDLKLNITILPMNHTYDNKTISRHESKKIKIPSNLSGNSSIILNAGNGNCIISLGAPAPLEKKIKGYATPVNAAYLLLGTIVLIGGTCACCVAKSKGRHHDGVPYQELEMEQQQQQQQQQQRQQQSLPYVGVETADKWDQSWDDDWDEEKAVRSPGGSRLKSRQANGFSPKPVDTNELGSD